MASDSEVTTAESAFLPWLDDIQPYVPGKPSAEILGGISFESLANLASNENALGPSPRALEMLEESSTRLHRYPDDQAQALKAALAARFSFPTGQIAVGNGSNDLINMLVRITSASGREVLMSERSFPTCRIAALGAGARLRLVPQQDDTHDLAAMAAAIGPDTHLVYVCNPNNPTGTTNGQAEVDRFLAAIPDHVLVVFDEAYFEYVERPDFPDLLPRILRGEQICVLRTFSKCHALAHLRVGYGFCPRAVTARIEKIRLPFDVNGVAQRAAIASLADDTQISRTRAFNAEGKRYLKTELERLGVCYRDSQTNFLMISVPEPKQLPNELLRRGVLIRPLQSFGLPADRYRVTVGTRGENSRFVAALEEVLRGSR